MKRPPMLKTATRPVAVTCKITSCVRERTSRQVQKTRLSQKITANATKKKMITPTRFCNAPKLLPPDVVDVLDDAAVGATVAVAAAVAVACACAKISWIRSEERRVGKE